MRRLSAAATPAFAAWAYLGAGLVAGAAYTQAGLGLKTALALAMVGTGAAAVAYGFRAHRPAERGLWLLVVAALSYWAIGWVFWQSYIATHEGAPAALDSWQNLLYLGMYPLLLGSLLALAKRRENDAMSYLDMAIIGTSLGVIAWIHIIQGYVHDETLSETARAGQILFTAGDVVLIAVLARLVVSSGRRTPALWLVLAGVMAYLVSNLTWNWSTRLGDYLPGSWADLGWLLFSVLIGAAALHPSMATLFEARPFERRRLRWGRFSLLVLATLVAPTTLALETIGREDVPTEFLVVAFATGLVGVLVLARMAGIVRESERLAASLGDRNAVLLELDRQKDDFIASVSHELRTPLTSIRGYLDLVREGEPGSLTDEQDKFLGVVDRNADRLLRVVSDLLFVAQVGDSKLDLSLEDIQVEELVDNAAEVARPLAESKDLELSCDIRAVPAIRGDRARLGQVLDNLVSNAIKFTPPGGRVRIDAFAENGSVVVEVSDTGMGISAGEQEQLFARFYRTPAASEHAIQGTGLGLTIVKAIIEAHHGTIGVTSRTGAGSTFRVVLPSAGVSA